MTAVLRLYFHALALFAWAGIFAVFAIDLTTFVVIVVFVTTGVAAVVAERERARRRREQAGR